MFLHHTVQQQGAPYTEDATQPTQGTLDKGALNVVSRPLHHP